METIGRTAQRRARTEEGGQRRIKYVKDKKVGQGWMMIKGRQRGARTHKSQRRKRTEIGK